MTDKFKWLKKKLENLSVKWPPKEQAKKKASRPSQLADKRTKREIQCKHCRKWFRDKDIQMDHIQPKGKYTPETFLVWLDRLFCPVTGYQALCRPCHVKKSATEHKDGSYK